MLKCGYKEDAMGRLRKSVIDQIVKLRKAGYTQAETAEQTEVHLKTVQKYDPLRKRKKETINAVNGSSMDRLDDDTWWLVQWVKCMVATLQFGAGIALVCPSCRQGNLALNEIKQVYYCERCNHLMLPPSSVWRKD